MPRRESKQHELFETGLFLVGGCQPYLRNIGDLVRLLPPGEADVAQAIAQNVHAAQKQISRAQLVLCELADVIGYKYLRRKEKKWQIMGRSRTAGRAARQRS